MDIWTWFERRRQEYLDRQDSSRLRLVETYSAGYATRETAPAQTVVAYAEAAEQARLCNEPIWRLLYEKFRLDALMHFLGDFRDVLDHAGQLVKDAEQLANVPEPFLFHDTLLAAYLGVDAVGHADLVREVLAQWEPLVSQEPCAARYLLFARRRQLAFEQERWDDAEELVERELDFAGHDPDADRAMHFSVFANAARCRLAYQRGTDELLTFAAGRTEELAQRTGHLCLEAEATAWLALAARRAKNEDDAQEKRRRALVLRERLGMPPTRGYFTALAAFHEHTGSLDAALDVRAQELMSVAERNRLLDECRVRLERCRLLARLCRPVGDEIEQARTAAAELRYPEPFVDALERLQKNAA